MTTSSDGAAATTTDSTWQVASRPMPPKITVYIPNLDGGERLRRTLESLAAQTMPSPVVVVDNASRDDSALVAERDFGARVIRLERNVGFGRALNHAVA